MFKKMTKETIIKMLEKVCLELVKSTLKKLNENVEFECGIKKIIEEVRTKIKKDLISVKYDYTCFNKKKDKHYGRLMPNHKSCLCSLPSDIRSHLAQDNYQYIDLTACHAGIILDLSIYYELDSSGIKEYYNNRSAILEQCQLDKKYINEMCNNQYAIPKHKFAKNIHNMIYSKNGLVQRLKGHEYFMDLWFEFSSKKATNPEGSFISMVCQTFEAAIVERSISFFRERGYEPNSYIFDGLLYKKEYVLDLKNLNNFIKSNYYGVDINPIFKFEEFFISEQYRRVFNRTVEECEPDTNSESKSESEEMSNLTDYDVAEYIFNQYSGKLINNNKIFYAYYKNEWVEDLKPVFNSWFQACELNIVMNPKKPGSLVRERTKDWILYSKQLTTMCDRLPTQDILDKKTGFLPFQDGIYNFETKEFKLYSDDFIHYFTYKVSRNFPVNSSKVDELNKILLDIFNEDEDSFKEVFSFWARSLGKHTTDKLALLLVGERDCGKGLIIQMIEQCFKSVIGNVNSGDLISKVKSFETAERKNGCLAPMCNNLICLSQEINPKVPFDGTLWRTMVSGGDVTSYRTAYGRLTEKAIRSSITFTANDVISFDLPKSSDTLIVYNMPCKYVEQLCDNSLNLGFVRKLANTKLKESLLSEDFLDAFTIIVLSNYLPEKPEYIKLKENSKIISETLEDNFDDGSSLYSAFNSLYTINRIKGVDIRFVDVHKKMRNILPHCTPAKVQSLLQSNSVKVVKIKGHFYYRGLLENKDSEESQFD